MEMQSRTARLAPQKQPRRCAPELYPTDTCCELVCFERPNYFCGHLLTDSDLMQEQRYFRDKNKLYHRTLHGHGIVCGLRLTCDHQCKGAVQVGDGFAIDDCGNDLIVCEAMPIDVISVLRGKGLLVEEPERDPCKPAPPDQQCKIRQCFYITICYNENPAGFETPFVTGCKSGPLECEPTRVREEVTIDVVSELPKEAGPIDNLKDRLGCCFKLFSEGAFAQALKNSHALLERILGTETEAEIDLKAYYTLFCELRGLLILYLKQHPDRYNCRLDEELREIRFPKDGQERERTGELRDAFCRLLGIAWQHTVSRALGELVPVCHTPAHASCVVLGTVEVENGCVVRVCNCPRRYVWSFAHFTEVLLGTLLEDLACTTEGHSDEHQGQHDKEKRSKKVCCREFDLDCKWLFELLRINPEALRHASTAAIDAAQMLRRSVAGAFDFTRAGSFSPLIFQNKRVEDAESGAKALGAILTAVSDEPLDRQLASPAAVLRMLGLGSRDTPLVMTQRQGTIATAAVIQDLGLGLDTPSELASRLASAEAETHKATERVQALEAQLAELKSQFEQLSAGQRQRRGRQTPGKNEDA